MLSDVSGTRPAPDGRRALRPLRLGAAAVAVVAVLSACGSTADPAGEARLATEDAVDASLAAGSVAAPATAPTVTSPAPRRPRPEATSRPTAAPARPSASPRPEATAPGLDLPPLRSGNGTTHVTTVQRRGNEEFGTGTVKVWLPDGVRTVRGLMVPGFFPGEQPKDPKPEGEMATLALKYHLGVVTHAYTHREGTRERREAYCHLGSAQGLARALTDLAGRTGHPEIASAPLVIRDGYSLAGLCAKGIAETFPERTAVLAYGGMSIVDCAIPGVEKVPTFIAGGAEDGFVKNIPAEMKACRAKGMPIAVALQPGRGHQISGSKPSRNAFLDAVLALRLPVRAGGPLRPVDLSVGHLADNTTHQVGPYGSYRGDKVAASWLPSAEAAKRWQEWTTPR